MRDHDDRGHPASRLEGLLALLAEGKDAGFIVCSCFGRPLHLERPANTAGLTYQGIFTRTGNVVSSGHHEGDYLEFGVFDGTTMSLVWHTMGHIKGLRFFGFDSYAGIIGSQEAERKSFPDGSYYSNLRTFMHNMATAGADPERVVPVPGNFLEVFKDPEALQARLGITRCRVAHIDCDVYQAAKASLDFISNIIIQGAVLLFDEFHANAARNDQGERKALAEWLSENPHISVERWHDYAAVSRAYIVHVER